MNCDEARLLMLERPDERRKAGVRRSLARHLATCPGCQSEFSETQLTAEYLSAWDDAPVGEHQKRACLEVLLASVGASGAAAAPTRSPRPRLAWRCFPSPRAALVLLVAAVALVVGPIGGGGGIAGISADIGDALGAIETWSAEGTATPPLVRAKSGQVCNHIEVWFRKPDSLAMRIDRETPSGPAFSLTREAGNVALFDPEGVAAPGLERQTALFRIEQLFDVSSWVARRSVMHAPVQDLGLSRFGDRYVRKIRVVPREGWLADSAYASEPGIQILVDAETMLPVLLETRTHGSVVILDFDYGTRAPAGLFRG